MVAHRANMKLGVMEVLAFQKRPLVGFEMVEMGLVWGLGRVGFFYWVVFVDGLGYTHIGWGRGLAMGCGLWD
jgi:hypothetical protein